MNRALFAAGWMMLLFASTGCLRVDGGSLEVPGEKAATPARLGLVGGCNEGEVPRERAAACLSLAGYFEEGAFGFPRDPGRAAQLRESAVDILLASCESGKVADCTRTAVAMGSGLPSGGEPDAAVAEAAGWMVQYAEEGCRGGDASGCALLGVIYEHGRGVAPDEERSTAYYDQACGGGHRQSCLILASREEGSGAVRAYERACRAGSGFGCATAAQQHRKGAGVQPSMERAGALFARGCSLGAPIACILGAEMYANAASPDLRRAMELAWAGCKQGIAGGCLLLGELLDRRHDGSRAREAHRQACELGEEKGCDAARPPRRQYGDPGWESESDLESDGGD